MQNPFAGRIGLSGPTNDIQPVTPSATDDLPEMAVALYVTTGGDLSIITEAGETRTITVPDNFILPVGARRVLATSTASGIHAFVVR